MNYDTIFAEVFQSQIGRILQDSISNDQYKVEIINHVKATGQRIYDTEPAKFTGDILVNLVKTLIESIAEKQTAVDRTEFLSVLNNYEKLILVMFCRDKMDFHEIAVELKDSENEVYRIYSQARNTVNSSYSEAVQGSALTPVGLLYSLDKKYRIPRVSKPIQPARTETPPNRPSVRSGPSEAPAVQNRPSGFKRAGSLEIEPLPFASTLNAGNPPGYGRISNTSEKRRTKEIRTGDNSYRFVPVEEPPVQRQPTVKRPVTPQPPVTPHRRVTPQRPAEVRKKSSNAAVIIIILFVAFFVILVIGLI